MEQPEQSERSRRRATAAVELAQALCFPSQPLRRAPHLPLNDAQYILVLWRKNLGAAVGTALALRWVRAICVSNIFHLLAAA